MVVAVAIDATAHRDHQAERALQLSFEASLGWSLRSSTNDRRPLPRHGRTLRHDAARCRFAQIERPDRINAATGDSPWRPGP